MIRHRFHFRLAIFAPAIFALIGLGAAAVVIAARLPIEAVLATIGFEY